DAARQGDEGVRHVLHGLLALGHRLGEDEARAALKEDAGLVKEAGGHAGEAAALAHDAPGGGAHEPARPAAENQLVSAPGKLGAQLIGRVVVALRELAARRAENADLHGSKSLLKIQHPAHPREGEAVPYGGGDVEDLGLQRLVYAYVGQAVFPAQVLEEGGQLFSRGDGGYD